MFIWFPKKNKTFKPFCQFLFVFKLNVSQDNFILFLLLCEWDIGTLEWDIGIQNCNIISNFKRVETGPEVGGARPVSVTFQTYK